MDFSDKAQAFFPRLKDWPPENERKVVDVYELYKIPRPMVKEGTDPDGPTGLQAPPQEVAGRPDAYVEPDQD